jgi:hypothetical protein
MRLIDLLIYLSLCVAGFGALWCFLTVRKIGLLELIERLGFALAAWARAQKYAQKWRRFEYQAMRETEHLPDDIALEELRRIAAN